MRNIFSTLYLCFSCFQLGSLQLLDDSAFRSIDIDWSSEQQNDNPLVNMPVLDFANNTAVTFTWNLETTDMVARIATNFELEISSGPYSDDFEIYENVQVQVPERFSNNSYGSIFTVTALEPESTYRFRICPVFSSGRGDCSHPLRITTLADSKNYWEPVLSRRLSLVASGRGFTNPVLQRPHLDTGVEIHGDDVTENPLRFSDPVTSETPVIPSGRRGHSLSLVDQTVYMYGGRTNGYGCATVYKDTLSLGNTESGRDVYPCTHLQGEVSEVWSFDINTYQWIYLNTSKWQSQLPPPAREQHSTGVIQRDLYVYGGKTRIFEKNDDGSPILTHHKDIVFNDLWKLSVERAKQYLLVYPNASTGANRSPIDRMEVDSNEFKETIPQNGRLLASISGYLNSTLLQNSDGVTPREGLCIDKVKVRVKLTHPCLRQVRVTIRGSGPQTGSPNFFPISNDHEVVLFNQLQTNGTGCAGGVHYFEFDDDSTQMPEDCCTQNFNGTYRPQGRLAEFIGTTMTAQWTLALQDLTDDVIVGSLLSWEIEFLSSPCVKQYLWTNLTSTVEAASAVDAPSARYGAHSIAHTNSLFIYGGRDEDDKPLHDLYRFDIDTLTWTVLTPVNFDVAMYPSSSVGANFALTSWGMMRFGGYYRQPTIPQEYDNYDSSLSVQDPVTLRWRIIPVESNSPLPVDRTLGRQDWPAPRYLGAVVFIPSHSLHWDTKFTHRHLYDQLLPSPRTNYQGSIGDSLLMIGGFDGSTGSVYDGSSSGYFSDIWMLRLANWSTPGSRHDQQQYLERHCRWRGTSSGLATGTESCLSSSGSSCEWRDLVMLPWCSLNNQSIV